MIRLTLVLLTLVVGMAVLFACCKGNAAQGLSERAKMAREVQASF